MHSYQGKGLSSLGAHDAAFCAELFRRMLRIRRIEEEIERRYHQDQMKTPIHLVIGQEATAVGCCAALRPTDLAYSSHRTHGVYLAKGGDLRAMLSEMHCRANGCAGSRGGSMHLIDFSVGMAGTSAIVAGSVPLATGAALAAKMQRADRVVTVFFGEGDELVVLVRWECRADRFDQKVVEVVAGEVLDRRLIDVGKMLGAELVIASHVEVLVGRDRRNVVHPALELCDAWRHRTWSRLLRRHEQRQPTALDIEDGAEAPPRRTCGHTPGEFRTRVEPLQHGDIRIGNRRDLFEADKVDGILRGILRIFLQTNFTARRNSAIKHDIGFIINMTCRSRAGAVTRIGFRTVKPGMFG